jgi:predicted HTH domain antitoxin
LASEGDRAILLVEVLMSVLTLELPDAMLAANAMTPEAIAAEARLFLAAKWFEMGRLSGARAAQLAGLSRAEFVIAVSRLGISPIQVDPEDIDRELAGV